ncbi:hypothetical protein, partial [Vibrio parahaemolyticus]|uniref:hypothetical protein n=1 Tax=Vibrio parahaemolyticus TaxID=670 RepID=UPI001C5EF00E
MYSSIIILAIQLCIIVAGVSSTIEIGRELYRIIIDLFKSPTFVLRVMLISGVWKRKEVAV